MPNSLHAFGYCLLALPHPYRCRPGPLSDVSHPPIRHPPTHPLTSPYRACPPLDLAPPFDLAPPIWPNHPSTPMPPPPNLRRCHAHPFPYPIRQRNSARPRRPPLLQCHHGPPPASGDITIHRVRPSTSPCRDRHPGELIVCVDTTAAVSDQSAMSGTSALLFDFGMCRRRCDAHSDSGYTKGWA